MVHLDHLLQSKPIRLRFFSFSQVTGSIEEPFALVKRLRTNWLLGVPRMKRRRIGFSTDAARDKGSNRETDPKQGAEGRSWRCASLPRDHADIPPSPCSLAIPLRLLTNLPSSQLGSVSVSPGQTDVDKLAIREVPTHTQTYRLRACRCAPTEGGDKSAIRELLEDCRLKRRRIGSLPCGYKMTARRRESST